MTKTFAILRRKTPQPRMATPSASFPPLPAAVVTPAVPAVVADSLDAVRLLLADFKLVGKAFPPPFFDILEESRRAGNRNGYNHSSAARNKAGCHAFKRRDSSL